MKKEKPLSIRLYEKYTESFDKCTDQEIIAAFNSEAVNCGWGTARASYLGALHKQLDKRKFNYSETGDMWKFQWSNDGDEYRWIERI